MSSTDFPDLGNAMTVTVTGIPAGQPGTLFFGSSATTWGSFALPVALDGLGFTGCSVYISLDIGVPLATGSGTAAFSFTIPTSAPLIGGVFYNQYANLDLAANPAGATFSNAAKVTIGD